MDPVWITELQARPQFTILSKLVKKDGESSVTEALQELNEYTLKMVTVTDSNKSLGNHIYYTFLSLLELVDHVRPFDQNKLVQFLVKLQQTPVSNPTSRKTLRFGGKEVWTGLPTFGYTAADNYKTGVF